jgi:hypothetical protein
MNEEREIGFLKRQKISSLFFSSPERLDGLWGPFSLLVISTRGVAVRV